MYNLPMLRPALPKPPQPPMAPLGQLMSTQDMPQAMSRHVITQYHKQLVTTRTMAFHQQTVQMMNPEERTDPAAKRELVIKRVARELWTNFTVRGEDTPMLRHLCKRVCIEYGEPLEFTYKPGGFELMVLRRTEEGLKPLSSAERLDITNKAWTIAKEVVESYVA